jgi:hypothetical protein
MQNLNLDQVQKLQRQKHQQQQAPPTQIQSPQDPIPAPQPQRATGMWTPDMPIKFSMGGDASGGQQYDAQADMGQKMDGRWDPSKGVRFG